MRPLDPRVLPHLRPARLELAGVVAGQAVGGVLVVAQAFALAATVVGVVSEPSGSGWQAAALALLAVTCGRVLVTGLVDVLAARAAGRVGTTLRHTVLKAALDLDANDLAERRTGEVAALATHGVAAIEPYLTRYLPALVVAGVLPILTVLAIASQDGIAALIVLVTLPLVPVFAILIGLSSRERADRQWQLLARLSGHFVDVVRGLPTLVAHRRATAQGPRIREVTDRYRRANRDVLRLAFASSAALELVATLSVALVAVVTGLRLAGGDLGLQTALTVLLLAPEAYWPLRRVGAEYHAAAEGTATFEAVHHLTTTPRAPHGHLAPPPAPAPIQLSGLTITWPGRSTPAVLGLDAAVPACGLTVLTGPSGCGKSTVLSAVVGELTAARGRITVGGSDLGSLDPVSWREQVAYLPQRPWLLDGTVEDNVRVGRPDAPEDAVRAALTACGLGAISPDTVLGEDGAGLSAGQRARLAMARVIVSERPYVVLDEPTAHLDVDTEQVLLRVVQWLALDRCVIAVAHSPALVAAADQVVALPAPPPSPPTATVPPVPVRGRTTAASVPAAPPPPSRPRLRFAGATLLAVLAATAGVALTATAGWLITRASEHPPALTLLVAIVGVRTFGLARPVLRYAERLVSHDVALRQLAEQRARVYELVVPLVPGRLGRRRGDLLASLVDDVDAHLDQELRVRMPVRAWLGTTAVTAAAASWFLPAAGALVAGCSLVAGAAAYWTAHRGAARRAGDGVAARADVSRRTLAVLTDARALVQWQRGTAALDQVDRASRVQAGAASGTARWLAVARAWPVLAAGGGVAAMAALVAPTVGAGTVSASVAALLLLLPLALGDVVSPVADAGSIRVTTRAATERVQQLAALAPAVTDPESPEPVPQTGRVGLRDVTAGWDGSTALAPVSLELAPGSAVGLVGPSGSGKSTLAALLVRFLAPATGEQEVGDVPVGRLRGDDVRRVVGLLDDDPYLFSSSLVENVRLARPEADDDAVELALRQAQLGPWLDALPDGLRTLIGDGAASVSGGERARIGLARLLLADHAVLVLDEPTAHLDAGTAQRVVDDLLALRGDHSLVWITHGTIGLDQMDEVLQLA